MQGVGRVHLVDQAGDCTAGRCRPADRRREAKATRSTRCWPVVIAVGLPQRPGPGLGLDRPRGVADQPGPRHEHERAPSGRSRQEQPDPPGLGGDAVGTRSRPGFLDRPRFTRFSVPAQMRARLERCRTTSRATTAIENKLMAMCSRLQWRGGPDEMRRRRTRRRPRATPGTCSARSPAPRRRPGPPRRRRPGRARTTPRLVATPLPPRNFR